MLRFCLTAFFCVMMLLSPSLSADFCLDKSSDCPRFVKYCRYNDSRVYKLMKDLCPLTCSVCSQNPCFQDTKGGCSDLCSWANDTVTCSCHPGFKLGTDKKKCIDINECTEGPNPCPEVQGSFCINTHGSYSCQQVDCRRKDPTTMNYYRSDKCCPVKNNTCGMTASVRSVLKQLTESKSGRISRGFASVISAWPWMAQIVENGSHVCGGTLLTRNWIITTSFCISGNAYGNVRIFVGHVRGAHLPNTPFSAMREERGIKRIVRNSESSVYGPILVELSQPVPINDVISPICLPCGDIPQDGDKCWATGFGVKSERDPKFATRLQEVDLPVVNIGKCIRAYRSTNTQIDRKTMMCAGYDQGGKDACFGDAGGPLVCQRKDSCSWYVAGITSFGRGCGRAGFFGVYANLFHYEKWIRSVLVNESSELCTGNYNPCGGLVDESSKCNGNPTACVDRHKGECALTCCLRRHGRVSDCFDNPKFKTACKLFKESCEKPNWIKIMKRNCRRTCAFC